MTSFIKRFRTSDNGSATVEFALLFPLFMAFFATGFEAGLYMVRTVMLERGVDLAVREVRLGGTDLPDLKGLKTDICKNALVLPNCVDSVQIQLESIPVQPGSIETVSGPVRCIDKMSDADPSTGTNYSIGSENEMMVVKVCALMKPLFPTTRLGLGMSVDSEGNNAIVAVAAFVNEPGQRALEQKNNNTQTGGGLTTGGDA